MNLDLYLLEYALNISGNIDTDVFRMNCPEMEMGYLRKES